jgi:hypothetical protein
MLRAHALRPRTLLPVCLTFVSLILFTGRVSAEPSWTKLVPFKKIDADPNKTYELGERNGPWMILAASFVGPTAEQQAHDLVLELRLKHKLEAFAFRKTYDFTKPTDGLGYSQYGGLRRMRYLTNSKFDEIAVLVGNYSSIEDAQMEKSLDLLKHAKPDCLDPAKRGGASSQRLAGLRTIYAMMSSDPTKKTKGPMGSAFVTRNPLLPVEMFVAEGIDPFIVSLNKDLPHNLLKCPGRYTVRVASFRGVDTMKADEFEKLTSQPRKMAKIDEAALKASRLCTALREKGVEAYEFHDRTESIVTIGSFNDVGQPRPDGKTEINPLVHKIMQDYGPIEQAKPGSNQVELYARVEKSCNIRFDPQPMPVKVPRQSIAAAYNATNSLFR